MRYLKLFEEYDTTSIKIDLNDDSTQLKKDRKYQWYGIEFTPKLNVSNKKYYTIIQSPDITNRDINEPFGRVVYGDTLQQLKDELKFHIPIYIEDELGLNLEDVKMKSEVADMERSIGIKYKDDYGK